MKYLLDTDVVSNPLKKLPSMSLLRQLATVPPEDQATTTITVGEMVFGALRTSRAEKLLDLIVTKAFANSSILDFDYQAAMTYGRLRNELEKRAGVLLSQTSVLLPSRSPGT